MVVLACLHTLALAFSPPPDLAHAILKWLPAPCCFASATFSRCGRITMGVRRRFNAQTLSEWACHTRLAAEGRVNRSERAPVYLSRLCRCRAALHCRATKADTVSHPKGYCCVNFAERLPPLPVLHSSEFSETCFSSRPSCCYCCCWWRL